MKYEIKIKIFFLFILIFALGSCRHLNTGKVTIIFTADTIDSAYSLPGNEILEKIKDYFARKEYVKAVEIEGLPEQIIEIELNKEKIKALEFDYDYVVKEMELQLKEKKLTKIEEIKIKNKKGFLIPLYCIASFKIRVEQHDVFYNGQRVYKIRIEYQTNKYEQLLSDLEELKRITGNDFIIDFEDFKE
jgi:multidrug efflux pump subunit AcrB